MNAFAKCSVSEERLEMKEFNSGQNEYANSPSEERISLDCTQCGKHFKNVPALNGHMRLHSTALLGKHNERMVCFGIISR